ncbi:MAG: autotransporter-associated beta strand repeat-containing protein, partial [Chthoniobacteraceae bacterium]|nr:autotransporter-associated beta strand repeat-containing protein [Chthoniobacteraceae bacterium]
MKQTLKGISKGQCDFSGKEKFVLQPNFGWPFRLLAFLIAFAVFFQGPVLVAATITWDPFKLYSSGSLGVSSGGTYGGTFSTLSSGHWLASGSLGSTVVPGTSDIVILNLGSAGYTINLSTGTIASIAGGTVSAGTGLAGTTISFAGSGTLAIGGTGFTVNAGTLSLGTTVLVRLLASQTWSVSTGSQMVVAGTITGTGFDLTKSGSGILTLSGSGGYTGSTYITAGTLSAGTGSLANTGTIVLSGGSLLAVDAKSGALFT